MTTTQSSSSNRQDAFGHAVAARLSAGAAELPYDISERLRAARMQAVAARKPEPRLRLARAGAYNGNGTLSFGEESLHWWSRIASAIPILALAAGLVLIHSVQNERRANEVAEVDAALLTDDLPPTAYADPGFIQFLKTGKE